jgi:hypothetical protein
LARTRESAVGKIDWPMIVIAAGFAALALVALWAAFGHY